MSNTSITERVNKNLKTRYKKEARFRRYGQLSIFIAATFLFIFFISIISKGYSAFYQAEIFLKINLQQEYIDPDNTNDVEEIRYGDFDGIINESIYSLFPNTTKRSDKRELRDLMSSGASIKVQQLLINRKNY